MTDPVVDLFCELARIPSPSGREAACGRRVVEFLDRLGLAVEADSAAAVLDGDCGNLYVRIAATEAGLPIFFCAHLDTVMPTAPIDPVEVGGVLRNSSPGIMGADNKAAMAVILDAIRVAINDGRPHAGIELVLTVGEETGLTGAKVFDVTQLAATHGYVFDHPGAIGGMVVAAPSRMTAEVTITGRAAHAGIAPEAGRNAIVAAATAIARLKHGRLEDGSTTLNVGVIDGGSANNVVAERCTVSFEARSLDDDRCGGVIASAVQCFAETAAAHGCATTATTMQQYQAYRLDRGETVARIAASALRSRGYRPVPLTTGGGADAHVFCARGRPCLNLAHGVEGFHSRDERVAVEALTRMRDVTLAIIDQAVRARLDTLPPGWDDPRPLGRESIPHG